MSLQDIFVFLEKRIYDKLIYLYLILLYIIFNIPLAWDYNIKSRKSWLIAGAIAFVFTILFCIVAKKRKIPKFNKEQIGIIFSIDMSDEKHHRLLLEKFVKPFQTRIRSKNQSYKVILVNKFIAERINQEYILNKKQKEFYQKTRCKFLIYGSCVAGNEEENLSCKLDLNSMISHKPIPKSNREILVKEMSVAFKPLKDIEILKKSETSDFERTSTQLNFAFDYILASAHLVSSEIKDALDMFISIFHDLKRCKFNVPVVNFIKFVINDRICFCYNKLASIEISNYYQNEDTACLIKAEQYLAESQKHVKDSYEYKLLIAICHFMLHRDVKNALKNIEDCKNISTDDSWKFSRVFLRLYQNDSIANFLNAYRVYNKSFISGRANFVFLNNLIDSILVVIKNEPEKKQMFFLLMLIYHYIGDEVEYKKYRNQFLDKYVILIQNENFKSVLTKIESGEDLKNLSSVA